MLCLVLYWYHYPNEIIYNIHYDSGWVIGTQMRSSYGWVDCVEVCIIEERYVGRGSDKGENR